MASMACNHPYLRSPTIRWRKKTPTTCHAYVHIIKFHHGELHLTVFNLILIYQVSKHRQSAFLWRKNCHCFELSSIFELWHATNKECLVGDIRIRWYYMGSVELEGHFGFSRSRSLSLSSFSSSWSSGAISHVNIINRARLKQRDSVISISSAVRVRQLARMPLLLLLWIAHTHGE